MAVVIPADIAKELGIRERQKLVVHRSGQQKLIKDWKGGVAHMVTDPIYW